MVQFFALMTAFCAMGFQLTLAQCITGLLGGAVLQYSLVIGLFIGSLGMGAATVAWKNYPRQYEILFAIECLLSWITPLIAIIIFKLDAHGLALLGATILSILGGFLSGMELPLLVSDAELSVNASTKIDETNQIQRLVGIDFLGTFAAAVAGPLVLFPLLNLTGTSAFLGILSAVAAGIPLRLILIKNNFSNKIKSLIFSMSLCNLIFSVGLFAERRSIAQWLSDQTFTAMSEED